MAQYFFSFVLLICPPVADNNEFFDAVDSDSAADPMAFSHSDASQAPVATPRLVKTGGKKSVNLISRGSICLAHSTVHERRLIGCLALVFLNRLVCLYGLQGFRCFSRAASVSDAISVTEGEEFIEDSLMSFLD